jgi:predicted PurR-regulated permease PerM
MSMISIIFAIAAVGICGLLIAAAVAVVVVVMQDRNAK